MRRASVILAALAMMCVAPVRSTDCYPKKGVAVEPNGQGVICYTVITNDDGSEICEYECVVNVYTVTFDADDNPVLHSPGDYNILVLRVKHFSLDRAHSNRGCKLRNAKH